MVASALIEVALCAGVSIVAAVLGEDVDTDMLEGDAWSHNNHLMDISSNSWGPNRNGIFVVSPGPLAKRALEMGVKEVCLHLSSSIVQPIIMQNL